MTDHLTEARACLSRVNQAATHFSAATWLTATCEQIIAHLEAQQAPRPTAAQKEPPMTDPKLHGLLDQTQFGDRLTLAHSNGKHTARVSGPVLTETHDPSVGIHLLDGQPHVVRNSTGVVWAPVVQAALHRGGEVIAKWDAADHLEAQQTEASLQRGLADITAGRTVDLGSFAQPATDPPAAQQCDSGHGDGGEAVQAVMAVLRDEGADSGGWHSWRCFDRDRYPEPCDCTEQVARAAIAAAEPHIRAEVRAQVAGELQYAAKAMTRFNAHPALADAVEAATAYREGIRDGLTAAAHIARQEQP